VGLTTYPWSGPLQVEALKVWFYSLAVSILLGLYQLSSLPSPGASETKDAPGSAPPASPSQDELQSKRRAIYKQMVVDMSDIIVPGHVAGWFPVDAITVGVAGSISGFLGAHSAWERVNGPIFSREV